jgi:hypothetical protein
MHTSAFPPDADLQNTGNTGNKPAEPSGAGAMRPEGHREQSGNKQGTVREHFYMMKKIIHSHRETAPWFALRGLSAGHAFPAPAGLCALVPCHVEARAPCRKAARWVSPGATPTRRGRPVRHALRRACCDNADHRQNNGGTQNAGRLAPLRSGTPSRAVSPRVSPRLARG